MSRSTPARRPACFIVNPAAGGAPPQDKLRAAIDAAAAEFHLAADVRYTDAPGHATDLAAEAEQAGVPLIFVAGGDGSLNEALNGLATSAPTLGVIPAGTANVWAREAGVPRAPLAALRAQLRGEAINVDVGLAGDRRFLLMASFGLDAAAVASVGPGLKRRLGKAAYVVAGLRVGLRYPGFQLELAFDDEPAHTVDASMIVLGNTRWYGSLAQLTPRASAVDGMLDCVVFKGRGPWSSLRIIPRAALRRHLDSPHVLYRRAKRIRISATDDLPPMQLDGDAAVDPAVDLSVASRALKVFVPKVDQAVFRAT